MKYVVKAYELQINRVISIIFFCFILELEIKRFGFIFVRLWTVNFVTGQKQQLP